ncbi:MAG: beta-ketoacyl synthase N-terminal-like domain-containing protein, partial [Acidobacteriota bacterium]
MVQVTSPDEARRVVQSGADGVVVKGNESGGSVGEETTFILLQMVAREIALPVYARGGIGLRTAAACLAAGVTGLLLDWQLALCEESELPQDLKNRITRMDGSETVILGQDWDRRYRILARPTDPAYLELKGAGERAGLHGDSDPALLDAWKQAVEKSAARQELLLVGQDACFAAGLADEYKTVRAICAALQREAGRQCRAGARLHALSEQSPLAQSHGTRFPIAQGPMTRVSDRTAFALAVADGGALPFLALALMRGPEVAALLQETKEALGTRPWGIGILGFVPKELRDEQMAEARKYAPPFAVIAGGRPDQASSLESEGTRTYLHVPSPELLRSFLEAGARKVIFEGRECGGHVGPRTSLVLWECMIGVLLRHLRGAGSGTRAEEYHVLFAGGVHDGVSASMVAALAAPLSERGVRIGVLIGTAYLFTEEAVRAGAITKGFQEEAIACSQTILLETGTGHSTRCAKTAFGSQFADSKRRLLQAGRSRDEIRDELEALNLGRLRIAAKGITRGDTQDGKPGYLQLDDAEQRLQGMYMIGQVAALRDRVCGIEEVHRDIASASERLAAQPAEARGEPQPAYAIVGLSCILPKAGDVRQYWHNIWNKISAITEVPASRWQSDLYFDADRRARDKVYSRWGGFLDDMVFDPVLYGMPPSSVSSVEPMQLLTLDVVREALRDAGYDERRFDRERTSVIVGTGGGVGELGLGYGFRSLIPQYVDHAGGSLADSARLIEKLEGHLPEWTEDSFAGLLLNVVAGRVANRFDLGGTNYIVDAACATSLAALRLGLNELESHSSDTVIVAASDMMQTPFGYLCFSKTQALSPTGQCRTFDETADGIVISEGIAAAIIKRLDDAERDGDRIHAILRSVGTSSDGRDKGLTAPRPIGQIRALERAYRKAGVAPETVGLMEA